MFHVVPENVHEITAEHRVRKRLSLCMLMQEMEGCDDPDVDEIPADSDKTQVNN